MADSGLRIERENPHRVGVIMGAGMGGMLIGEEEFAKVYMSNRPHRVHPNFIPMITLNSASGMIAMTFGAKGPNLTISTACSSSAHAIGLSLAAIRAGQADVVITGGAEASLTPLAFAGFCALRALSTAYNDQPTRASRPFDRARDGFVMGEGAATLILESLDHAIKRKAPIYAEVAGYAATSEAFHMVVPKEDGSEMAMTMTMGLARRGRAADPDGLHQRARDVHADRRSRRGHAIRTVFKKRADTIAVNATKSLIGHTLGAAGALGGVACVMALRTGLVHPTVNYDDPDPACELPGISAEIQERPMRARSCSTPSASAATTRRSCSVSRPQPTRGSRPRAR